MSRFFRVSSVAVSLWLITGVACGAVSSDKVSLKESTITWSTYKHAVNGEYGLVSGSYDREFIVDRTFKTWVLENRYLKVTLLPEYGGRVLSMIYKPTGHEQLYRTDVGVPYQIKTGVFYYDWLMVYGGIFPTFPEAEHGKMWLRPWKFEVVKESPEETTVAMSIKDDIDYERAPRRYKYGRTGIEAVYTITLKANRAALDTRITLKNPSSKAVRYEYWTCATLAPGSDPTNPRATGGAEIVAPIEAYTVASWSQGIASMDKSVGFGRYKFEHLRFFKNWPTMGIAYASPNMGNGNFWGVINHDNEEGIFRIADNRLTPGLKMWTWGFDTVEDFQDARKAPVEAQPYIELWAGVTEEFFRSATFPPKQELAIDETYAPTVGLTNVTHASARVLANLSAGDGKVNLQLFSLEPDGELDVTLVRGDAVLYRGKVRPDPAKGSVVSAPLPAEGSGEVRAIVKDASGTKLLQATASPAGP